MSSSIDLVKQWFWRIGQEIIPPLLLELVLRDGTRYYVQSVVQTDDETKSMVVRVWDLRELLDKDIAKLKRNVNNSIQSGCHDKDSYHPKLDDGNLRLHLEDVWYLVEWHHRMWPEELRRKIGFHATEDAKPAE